MIKELLLPSRIGSYYLFTESIVALEIQNNSIFAAKVSLSGRSARIVQWYSENVPQEELVTDEALIAALKRIKQQVGKRQQFVLSIPTSLVIFKELTLPFLEKNQIEEVLPFELEAQIPFPVDQVFFDCIIISQDLAAKQSTVLVAIVQQESLNYYFNLLSAADIPLSAVTIDLLNFYTIARNMGGVQWSTAGNALVVIYQNAISVGYCVGDSLHFVRTLNKGMQGLVRQIAQVAKLSFPTAAQTVAQQGAAGFQDAAAIQKIMREYFADVRYTIQALSTESWFQPVANVFVMYNSPLFLAEIDRMLAADLNAAVRIVSAHDLKDVRGLVQDVQTLDDRALLVVGSAYPTDEAHRCNLLRIQERMRESDIMVYRALASFGMGVLLIGLVFGFSWYRLSAARQEIALASNQLVNKMTTEFDIERGRSKSPQQLVTLAQAKIEQEGKIWSALSGKHRTSYLRYLYELTKLIDRESTKLRIKKLIITDTQVQLSGSVAGYPELRALEEELRRSEYFALTTIPQEPEFELTLTIKGK